MSEPCWHGDIETTAMPDWDGDVPMCREDCSAFDATTRRCALQHRRPDVICVPAVVAMGVLLTKWGRS